MLRHYAIWTLPALPVFAVLTVVFDTAWYSPLPYLLLMLFSLAGPYARLSRENGLPLVVGRDELRLTRRDGTELAVDWADLAVAEVRGRLHHLLVVEVAAPERTRPPLGRWEWARLVAQGNGGLSGIQRPHEIHVSLTGLEPGVDRLRELLAARTDAVADGTPAA
ncbi:hypothetical protein D7223_32030 [Micromonospora endolithica]|uniref:PH domain-containing protein n=1 Tax=Micromonospora endolithica TaxID=230091 RepID=A0A3A9YR31_9ACTN|nr:hypothetical protein D7223_32030 [Micromonospora endolithica]